MIRFFDILFSFLGILFLSPVFLFLYIAIRLESKGGGFYKQLRVGRGGADFYVYKFRSMRIGADEQGLIIQTHSMANGICGSNGNIKIVFLW